MRNLARTIRILIYVGPMLLLMAGASTRSGAQVLNGNFGTGDFTDWTVFATPNGDPNAGGPPDVQMFNVTGGGAQDAAHFNVGHLSGAGFTDPEGGGVFQNILLGAGPASFSMDFATHLPLASGGNADGGIFDMLLDGNIIATDDTGGIGTGQTIMGTLTANENVTAGSHQLEIEVLRPFTAVGGLTPDQYFTNIVATGSQLSNGTPEPGSIALLCAFGISGVVAVRRRRSLR